MKMKAVILILVFVTLSFTSINAQVAKAGSVGLGIGVPYGVVGINGEFAVHKYFSLSAGLGSSIFSGLGYAVGARAYLKPAENKWRPRISMHYGVNGVIASQESFGSSSYSGKTFSGLTLGLGTLVMFGERRKYGFDFEVVYLATQGGLQDEIDKMNASGKYSHIDDPSKIKVVIGYRFGF